MSDSVTLIDYFLQLLLLFQAFEYLILQILYLIGKLGSPRVGGHWIGCLHPHLSSLACCILALHRYEMSTASVYLQLIIKTFL